MIEAASFRYHHLDSLYWHGFQELCLRFTWRSYLVREVPQFAEILSGLELLEPYV